MIRDNCRARFTWEDFTFIADSLGKNESNRSALFELLTDADSRDEILDNEALFNDIIRHTGLSRISPYLYFYVLSRKALLDTGLDDRRMTDYVACMLAEFCSLKRVHNISKKDDKTYHYLVDIMQDFVEASSREAFLLRSHLANYALFMSGVFPDFVFRKSTYGRKAPGFDYYEKMGSSSYLWASRHRLALQYSLVEILANLGERFRTVRIALNHLADNYIVIDVGPDNLDKMLRQVFFGGQNQNKPNS